MLVTRVMNTGMITPAVAEPMPASWLLPFCAGVVTALRTAPPGWLLQWPRDGCVFFRTQHALFPVLLPSGPQGVHVASKTTGAAHVASRVLPRCLAQGWAGSPSPGLPRTRGSPPLLQTMWAMLQSGSPYHGSHFWTLLTAGPGPGPTD